MTERLRALAFATFVATLLAGLLDFGAVDPSSYAAHPSIAFALAALALAQVLQLFAPTYGWVLCVGLYAVRPASKRTRARLTDLLPWLGSAIAVGSAYRHLASSEPFSGWALAGLPYLGLFVAVGIAGGDLRRRALIVAVPRLALIGAVLAYGLCFWLHRDHYPSLRLSLSQIGHLLLLIACWHGARRLSELWLRRLASPWLAAVVLGFALLLPRASSVELARPLLLSSTPLGYGRAALEPYVLAREKAQKPVSDDPEGVARFLNAAHLPVLPAAFDLSKYNVLLILSEATRFDQTSLADGALGTTPSLQAFHRSGAALYTQAFAPSSRTFTTLCSLFGFGYPSLVGLETGVRPWTGRFLEPALSAVSLLDRAGYRTFWIGHNSGDAFDHRMLGLDAGFQTRKLVPATTDADAVIADATIAALRDHAASAQPFFGFIFFVSPHARYDARYPDMPASTPLELYRQDVRFMDEQLGRVLGALDELDLAKRTIVIFAGDHGEEFSDHGGEYHRASVYTEALHVPLLVRVPGPAVEGPRIEQPTSLAYVLPWLSLRGPPELRAFAERRIRQGFGPMLRATGDAVVAELLGHDYMKTTLIYPELRLVYDFRAQRIEVYRDEREQHDLYFEDSALALDAQARVAAYRDVRAARRRFRLAHAP